MDPQAFTIIENDEVDLVALRRCFADSKLAIRKTLAWRDIHLSDEYERYIWKHAHEQLSRAAVSELVRYDGKGNDEKAQTSTYAWSLYGIHPDTAEQMIRAIDFLIDRFGPRFNTPQQVERHSPKIKRNQKED